MLNSLAYFTAILNILNIWISSYINLKFANFKYAVKHQNCWSLNLIEINFCILLQLKQLKFKSKKISSSEIIEFVNVTVDTYILQIIYQYLKHTSEAYKVCKI